MSEKTKIQWADSTLNFWSGCTKVSAGCAHCYAETLSNRGLTKPNGDRTIGQWGQGAPRVRHQSAFDLALRLNKKPWVCDDCGHSHTNEPNRFFCDHCTGHTVEEPSQLIPGSVRNVQVSSLHRRRIFSLSLGDWLDPEVPIEWLAELLDVIRRCDQVQWLLVTKRPELWESRLRQAVCSLQTEAGTHVEKPLWHFISRWLPWNGIHRYEPPPHIMLLASAENQNTADERIPELLKIPAASHGVSCEPLLGPIEMDLDWLGAGGTGRNDQPPQVDWVIVGGESGAGARPCQTEWLADLVDQCAGEAVPCFVKQLGTNSQSVVGATTTSDWRGPTKPVLGDTGLRHKKGGDLTEWPKHLQVRQWPK